METQENRDVLNLKAGEWVEVRSRDEVLGTLDPNGRFESLPFMPEMLQYCGRKFRVSKRADKTCDNIIGWSIRRLTSSVHLEGLRCDGISHGGCEAGCLIFWKEAWLKRPKESAEEGLREHSFDLSAPLQSHPSCNAESLVAISRTIAADGEPIYSCQATELRNFTSEMSWWDPRQYVRDVLSGNLSSGWAGDSRSDRVLEFTLGTLKALSAFIISVFREYRHLNYPAVVGLLTKTPVETVGLQPGELVQVRGKEEIMATLDTQNRNRGLLFDAEMLPHCGNIYRVIRRVHHIVDEKTGRMMHMKYPCIVLEGVYCKSDYHRFCPRAIYSYWREGWLKRATRSSEPIETRELEAHGYRKS